jgi:hypothetical protein
MSAMSADWISPGGTGPLSATGLSHAEDASATTAPHAKLRQTIIERSYARPGRGGQAPATGPV